MDFLLNSLQWDVWNDPAMKSRQNMNFSFNNSPSFPFFLYYYL